MMPSRTVPKLLLGTLVTSTCGMVLFTAWILWPEVKEQTFRRALANSSSPSFWWPTSVRTEYRIVQAAERALLNIDRNSVATIEAESTRLGRRIGDDFP